MEYEQKPSKFAMIFNSAAKKATKDETDRIRKIQNPTPASEDPERSEYSRKVFKGIDRAFNK